MKRFILYTTLLLILPCIAYSNPLSRIIHTDWIKQETLRQGMLWSLISYQTFNGFCEGYHFRQAPTYLINENNYHMFTTMQRLSGISTGFFLYANVTDKNQKWYDKLRRVIGSACIARNCFEWSYKYSRYNNPFDYLPQHNEHSIVYFGIQNGKLTDLYIGTGNITGPFVDILFLTAGLILLK